MYVKFRYFIDIVQITNILISISMHFLRVKGIHLSLSSQNLHIGLYVFAYVLAHIYYFSSDLFPHLRTITRYFSRPSFSSCFSNRSRHAPHRRTTDCSLFVRPSRPSSRRSAHGASRDSRDFYYARIVSDPACALSSHRRRES